MDKKNYITPKGFKNLKNELDRLLKIERPETVNVVAWAASNGDRSENADYHYGKKKLREIDKRIQFLNKQIDNSIVIDPIKQKGEKVQFGATVKILDEQDIEKIYTIVGVDEIDIEKGLVSWQSPIGKALLNSKKGDFITYKTPKGEQGIEILDVKYITIT